MILHWVRHTTPKVAKGICYGQADLDVTDSFSAEAATIKQKLLNKYDQVYTSPLQRCSKLAQACTKQKVTVDDRLMEFNFGDWELKPWEEIKGEAAQAWFNDFVEVPCPNGENMNLMQQRVLEFYQELLDSSFDSVAIFTHSGVQRIIHAEILSTPLKHMFRLQLPYGAVIECRYNPTHNSMTVEHL